MSIEKFTCKRDGLTIVGRLAIPFVLNAPFCPHLYL